MFSFQYKELQATKLCLSRDGMLGMLSSRRHLVLLDLEEPEEILRKVGRTSRWEVGGAQWNPHSQLASHVSVCSNDKVEVWLWGAGGEASDILDTGDCAAVHTQTTKRGDCFSSNVFYMSYKMKK